MPIGALRLINPPGHTWRRSTFPRYMGGSASRRSPYANPQSSDPLGIRASFYAGTRLEKRKAAAKKKAKGNPMIKRRKKVKVKTNRPRFKTGPKKGQFMSNAAIARSRAAKRNAAKPKANPKRKRRTVRKAAPKRNPVSHTSKGGRKRTVSKKQLRTKKARKHYATLKSGSLSGAEYKKEFNALWALRKQKGKKTVAKKRKTKKTKTAGSRKGKRSAASYKKAARKAARTRAAKKARRSMAAKKAASKRKRHGKKSVSAPRKARKSRKSKRVGGGRKLSRKSPIRFIYKTKKSGKTKHGRVVLKKTRKSNKRRSYMRPYVKRNPGMADFKSALISGGILFGGLIGMRVLANVIKQQLFDPGKPLATATTSLGPKVAPLLPAGLVFVGSMFLGKVVKNPKIVSAAQSGAALVLFDAVFNNLIKPSLPANVTALLGGVNDMGYGRMGEYLPQRQQLPVAGYGLDVQEAMALDEYVPDRGMGMQVDEALAESEVDGMQRGYAAGSLSRTVFSS